MAGKKYKTIIWHDPIYELQENEVERHHHYFKLWDEGDFRTYKEFYQYLTTLSPEKWHKYDKDTKKNPSPPTVADIKQFAAHGKWKIRRQTRINDEESYNRDIKRKIFTENEISEFKQKQSIKNKLLDRVENSIDDYEKLSQINQGVQAYTNLKEDDRKDLGISEETLQGNSSDENDSAEIIEPIKNPDWENPNNLKARRDMFWSMIKPRGE